MRRLAVLLAGCALTAACSGPDAADPVPGPTSGPPATTPSDPPTASDGPTPRPTPRPVPPRPFTLALAGDVHFEGVLRDRLADPATALAPATRTLAAADLAVLNLETAVATGGDPEPGKRYLFRAPASAYDALAAAGVDVASMANNHALDYGRSGLRETLAAARRAPLAVVGVGRDTAEAFAPAYVETRDTTVAVVAATVAGADPTADPTGQWAATATSPGTADALDPARLLTAVAAADRRADVVVAYLHWGVQGESCPSDLQRTLARRLVAAGADVVAGSHTHGLQGDGRLGPAYVAYGLGNYAWYTESDTGVLTLTVRPPRDPAGRARVTRAEWEPARVGTDGLPAPRTGSDAAAFADELADLRACAGLATT